MTDRPLIIERPSGRYREYARNEPCTVWIVEMKPSRTGSLQSHQNFDELWIMLTDGGQVQVADDALGRLLLDQIQTQGLDVRGVRREPGGRTASTFILRAEDEDRPFIHSLGVAATFTGEYVSPELIPAAGTRIFHVYFGGPTDVPTPEFEGLVTCTDNIRHEGQDSIKVETSNVTYYYHMKGAAFTSLEDNGGDDWLGYNLGVGPISKSGSGGQYRGLPNMDYPEGYCHPGQTVSSSRIVSQCPIRVAIASESNDGKMKCRWDIFPDYARLTILKMRTPYWFLYEGSPGGKLETSSDICVKPAETGGFKTSASRKWDGDIVNLSGPGEWLYFAYPVVNRSLFLIHHNDDEAMDSYWPMKEEMTVFGFGRKGLNKFIRTMPAQFTIGLWISVPLRKSLKWWTQHTEVSLYIQASF